MSNQLTGSTKISYGLGQVAWASKDTCFQFFLFFYYTQMLGLSPSLAGLAALLALVADAISDPIIGQVSDHWRSQRWGRRHPFMIASVVPFCLSLVAIFNPPAELTGYGLFLWYLGWAIAVRTFLTLFTVPHMALGAELTEDYSERTSIAVYRNLIAYLGGLSIQVVAWFVLIPTAIAAGHIIEGYRQIGYVGAVLAFVCMLFSILGTKSHIPRLVAVPRKQESQPWYFAFANLMGLLRIQSARAVLLGSLVMATTVGVSSTMLLHINTYFYGFSSEQMGVFMLAIVLSLVPASWMAMKGTQWFGKPISVIYLLVAAACVGPMPVLLHLYGLTPENGSGALLAVVCSFIVLHQAFYIAKLNVVAAIIPDVVDEIELETGVRQEGILNSAMMLTQKVTFGLGAFFAGVAIELSGFKGVTSVADMSADMLTRLAWMYGPGLSLMLLLSAYCYSRYKVNHQRYDEIRIQLESARESH